VQQSRTKHIEIRHHFISDNVNNGYSEIQFVISKKQLDDLFTKALGKDGFNLLQFDLGIIDLNNVIYDKL